MTLTVLDAVNYCNDYELAKCRKSTPVSVSEEVVTLLYFGRLKGDISIFCRGLPAHMGKKSLATKTILHRNTTETRQQEDERKITFMKDLGVKLEGSFGLEV